MSPAASIDRIYIVLCTTLLALSACDGGGDAPAVTSAPLAAAYKASLKRGVLTVTGTNADSRLALRLGPNGTLVVDVGDDGSPDFSFDRSKVGAVLADGGGGNDVLRIDESQGAFSHELPVTLSGGAGNDTLLGGVGPDTLRGGNGDDFIDGGPGADTIALGAGQDLVNWDPGDASDAIDGGDGIDRLVVNGANVGEKVALSAADGRLRLTRDVGSVALDVTGVEDVGYLARGGTDAVSVADLAGTHVDVVRIDLSATAGSTTGDGVSDVVTLVAGSADRVDVLADGATVVASGLSADVRISGGEPGLDVVAPSGFSTVAVDGSPQADIMSVVGVNGQPFVSVTGWCVPVAPTSYSMLLVQGLGGDDELGAVGNLLGVPLTLDGGDGQDVVLGGPGGEILRGGPGRDLLDGRLGADDIAGGDGDDTIVWNPGGSSDTVSGDAGDDLLVFRGANVGETIDVSAVAGKLRVQRDVGSVDLEAAEIEQLRLEPLGAADTVRIGDLAATSLATVAIDLAQIGGTTGDAQPDTISLVGAGSPASLEVSGRDGTVVADGLGPAIEVEHGDGLQDVLRVDGFAAAVVAGSDAGDHVELYQGSEGALVLVAGWSVAVTNAPTTPRLEVEGRGGDDVFWATTVHVPVAIAGGDGDDQIYGGTAADLLRGDAGADVIDGGLGQDQVFLGDGDDTVTWDPGDASDTIDGGAGIDLLAFRGANIGESIAVVAQGDHARVVRNVGTVSLDTVALERIAVSASGGADQVTVEDLATTAVSEVVVDLAPLGGAAGDGYGDLVTLRGSDAPDTIALTVENGAIVARGLAATVTLLHPETSDQLDVWGLGGADSLSADPWVPALIWLNLID